MFFEGTCQKCSAVVEFMCERSEKDDPRTHSGEDNTSQCDGVLKRVPYPRRFAVKWCYGPNDKKGCFMGPTNHKYKTDTTIKRDVRNTRTVAGGAYRGKTTKEREW